MLPPQTHPGSHPKPGDPASGSPGEWLKTPALNPAGAVPGSPSQRWGCTHVGVWWDSRAYGTIKTLPLEFLFL